MRLAISRRVDRALNFSASWIGRNSVESIEVTQRDSAEATRPVVDIQAISADVTSRSESP